MSEEKLLDNLRVPECSAKSEVLSNIWTISRIFYHNLCGSIPKTTHIMSYWLAR